MLPPMSAEPLTFSCPRRSEFLRVNTEPFVWQENGPDSFRVLPNYYQCEKHGWHPDAEQARDNCEYAVLLERDKPRTLCTLHHRSWPHQFWANMEDGPPDDDRPLLDCPGPTEDVPAEAPCSYCGSLSGDRFMELLKQGVELHGSDKSYKVYLSYGEHGQEKFYWQHLSAEQRQEFIRMFNAHEVNLEPRFGLYVMPFFFRMQ